MSLEAIFEKAEREWINIEQSSVVQKNWPPLYNALLGSVSAYPKLEELLKFNWAAAACLNFLEQRDAYSIRLKNQHQALNQAALINFIKDIALHSKNSPLFSLYEENMFEGMIYRLCTTTKPQKTEKNLQEYLLKQSLRMIEIPAGNYWIGNSTNPVSSPYHAIKLDRFQVGILPVTQMLWYDVMKNNPSKYKGASRAVEQVSWWDSIYFCNKLSEQHGKKPYYIITDNDVTLNESSNGYRLLTEAQWEVVARGEKSFGTAKIESPVEIDIQEYGWTNQTTGTRPIGQKKANPFGLYDIFGNVCTWCWDLYGSYHSLVKPKGNKLPYYIRIPEYENGHTIGLYRCYRGGGWNLDSQIAQPYMRLAGRADMKSTSVGLRICCPSESQH